jgi:type II secretory pathway component PulM
MKTLGWLAIIVLSVVLYTQVWAPLAKSFRSPFGTMTETLDKATGDRR